MFVLVNDCLLRALASAVTGDLIITASLFFPNLAEDGVITASLFFPSLEDGVISNGCGLVLQNSRNKNY